MEYENLKSAAYEITMPEEMKRRIAHNCKKQFLNTMEEYTVKNRKNNSFFKKPAAVFAVLAVCLSLSVTALAAGTLNGFFRDITNWQGAVVGTSYEQATDEIVVNVTTNGEKLTVLATFVDPQIFPYREVEKLGIASYRIVDTNGKTVSEGAAASAEVVDGHTAVSIKLDELDSGSYSLMISAFVGEKKAEQPLNINGSWECEFFK